MSYTDGAVMDRAVHVPVVAHKHAVVVEVHRVIAGE